jgi:hypothetical protein
MDAARSINEAHLAIENTFAIVTFAIVNMSGAKNLMVDDIFCLLNN